MAKENYVDATRVCNLIFQVNGDRSMPPAKQALLLTNLSDQLSIPQNVYSIQQSSDGSFNYSQRQIFNPLLLSVYHPGFFTLKDAVGASAIVDFANDRFGGGILGPNGFAQEEKLLMETNLIAQVGAYTGLSIDPLYIRALQTHEFVGPGISLYGNSRLGSGGNTIDRANISLANVGEYLERLKLPENVTILAMAALDMRRSTLHEYSPLNIQQMFETAYKGFRAHTEHGGYAVHSGAWGAGAFGNSENVTCVLQILAAQAAGVRLIYHGTQPAYDSAIRFLRGQHIVGQSYSTVVDSLSDYMQRRHTGSKFWRPQ